MSDSRALIQARSVLDGGAISVEDRSTFLTDLGSTLANGTPLSISTEQRQVWARALISVASFLLDPATEVPPVVYDPEEEEEFLLTQSEFETWEKLKEEAVKQAQPVLLEESGPPVSEEESSEEGTLELESPPPPPPPPSSGIDDFEDFVIDEVIVEQ
jgi:hypothetical protein